MKREKFTRDEIEKFRARATDAPSAVKTHGLSLREVIVEMADILTEMRNNRGYTIEDIVTWWHEQGVTISGATLRGYLKAAEAAQTGKSKPTSRRSSRSRTAKTSALRESTSQAVRGSSSTGTTKPPPEFPGLKISEDL